MNTSRWLQSLVVGRPDLYRAIYDWNAYPHRWALPVWLAEAALPPAVVSLLEGSSRGRERLRRHFTRALGLEQTWWDFQEPRARVALLGAEALLRLARYAGAALHASRLARVIAKEERRALTQRIGEDAYAFGMRSARAANVSVLKVAAHGNLPEDVDRSGWEVVAACLKPEPVAVHARLRLKVAPEINLPTGEAVALDSAPAWELMQAVSKEALRPEEARCLA